MKRQRKAPTSRWCQEDRSKVVLKGVWRKERVDKENKRMGTRKVRAVCSIDNETRQKLLRNFSSPLKWFQRQFEISCGNLWNLFNALRNLYLIFILDNKNESLRPSKILFQNFSRSSCKFYGEVLHIYSYLYVIERINNMRSARCVSGNKII